MKKLYTFTLTLAGVLMLAGNAEAAIIYTDITDVTKTQSDPGTQSVLVDMNGDAINDFEIVVNRGAQSMNGFTFNGDAVAIGPPAGITTSNVLIDGSSQFQEVIALASGFNIQSISTAWDNMGGVLSASGTVMTIPVTAGQFTNTTDKYIGVQFNIGANTHYGWIRVDVTGYNSFTVKDFAYEDVAGQSILAGAGTTTSISEAINDNTTIKNSNYAIIVEFAKTFSGKVDLVNMSGQIVKSLNVNGKSCTIEKATLSTGIYNLVITGQEGFATRKVAVQ